MATIARFLLVLSLFFVGMTVDQVKPEESKTLDNAVPRPLHLSARDSAIGFYKGIPIAVKVGAAAAAALAGLLFFPSSPLNVVNQTPVEWQTISRELHVSEAEVFKILNHEPGTFFNFFNPRHPNIFYPEVISPESKTLTWKLPKLGVGVGDEHRSFVAQLNDDKIPFQKRAYMFMALVSAIGEFHKKGIALSNIKDETIIPDFASKLRMTKGMLNDFRSAVFASNMSAEDFLAARMKDSSDLVSLLEAKDLTPLAFYLNLLLITKGSFTKEDVNGMIQEILDRNREIQNDRAK